MSCSGNQSHLVRPGRTTSRVLAPSGGQSSLTFGILPPKPVVVDVVVKDEPASVCDVAPPKEAALEKNAQEVVAAAASAANENEPKEKEGMEEKVYEPKEAAVETTTPGKMQFTSAMLPSQMNDAPVSGNAFVTGSNMNGGCVMTGRPSSRVLAPPGGHTSFKLG